MKKIIIILALFGAQGINAELKVINTRGYDKMENAWLTCQAGGIDSKRCQGDMMWNRAVRSPLPGGSYQQTCFGCIMTHGSRDPFDAASYNLECQCKTEDGHDAPHTTMQLLEADACDGRISNCDGALICGEC